MESYPKYVHLIDRPGRSYELARQMIPVLISWPQDRKSPQYYSTLSKAIGHKTARIGHQLIIIGEILNSLSIESGKSVPLLNALVVNKSSKRASEGLSEFIKGYQDWSVERQQKEMDKMNELAYSYKNWQWVLDVLGLMPYNESNEESIRQGTFSRGSVECPYHKALREYVLNRPDLLGIEKIEQKADDYVLLSGDIIDAYFCLKEGKQIAVEIKSRASDDAEILKGIYQCVKDKAILTAECQAHAKKADVETILVLEKDLSEENKKTANMLSVKYLVLDDLKN